MAPSPNNNSGLRVDPRNDGVVADDDLVMLRDREGIWLYRRSGSDHLELGCYASAHQAFARLDEFEHDDR